MLKSSTHTHHQHPCREWEIWCAAFSNAFASGEIHWKLNQPRTAIISNAASHKGRAIDVALQSLSLFFLTDFNINFARTLKLNAPSRRWKAHTLTQIHPKFSFPAEIGSKCNFLRISFRNQYLSYGGSVGTVLINEYLCLNSKILFLSFAKRAFVIRSVKWKKLWFGSISFEQSFDTPGSSLWDTVKTSQ